jgi:hypothetical protein
MVALSSLLDVTKWYQSHGFDTEPGWAMLVEVEARLRKRIVVEMDKIQVQSHGFHTEPGWAMNEKFGVKSPKNLDVPSTSRAWEEHLDCVQKHRRCSKFKKWPQRMKSQLS